MTEVLPIPEVDEEPFPVAVPIAHPAGYHLVFSVDFTDGYTLRQLFEFFKLGLPCAPIFMTENGLTIERSNGQGTLLARVVIDRRNLVEYFIDMSRVNDPEHHRHIVNFELGEFQLHIKSVGKKDGIRLFQYAEHPETVYGQPYGGNKNAPGLIPFPTQRYEDVKYEVDDGITEGTHPNVIIPLPTFCNACTNLSRIKHAQMKIAVYPRGVRLASGAEGGIGRESLWGEVSKETPFITAIAAPVIKALVKTANFQPNGIVRVFGASDQLVRLEIPVGCYAEMTIFLKGQA